MAASNNAERRKRRVRRRAAAVVAFLTIALGLAWFFESQSTTTVLFIRYAETAPGANPGLSEAGRQRAEELVRVLGDVDVIAGVDTIFATRFRHTQETAEPLARHLNLPVQIVDMEDMEAMVERLLVDNKGKISLVITSGELIPELIPELQGHKQVPDFAPAEHDNLYIVSIPWFGKVKTLRLRYGAPYLEP